MKVNGREINFAYTVGVWCDINDYVTANPDVSAATANVFKAVYMNKAYNEIHGLSNPLTVEEIRALPASVMFEMLELMKAAEKKGTERTVEAEEKKGSGTAVKTK